MAHPRPKVESWFLLAWSKIEPSRQSNEEYTLPSALAVGPFSDVRVSRCYNINITLNGVAKDLGWGLTSATAAQSHAVPPVVPSHSLLTCRRKLICRFVACKQP